jgi:hypothetical protein
MVQKYLESQVGPRLRLTAADLELYYKAHPERYSEPDAAGKPARPRPFGEVRDRVAGDLGRERQEQAVSELLGRMMDAENVRFFEDKVE